MKSETPFVWKFIVYVCSDRLRKLDEMIAAGERSKPLYDSIPETVARLESLQELHLQVQTICYILSWISWLTALLRLESSATVFCSWTPCRPSYHCSWQTTCPCCRSVVSLRYCSNYWLNYLQQTKKKFESNRANINQNFESLFKRIEKIQKMKK